MSSRFPVLWRSLRCWVKLHCGIRPSGRSALYSRFRWWLFDKRRKKDRYWPHRIHPMGSGCGSIIDYPYQETQSENPRCILGMFDVSARPCVPAGKLTFTIPMQRFEQMVLNMDESFLITKSWDLVRKRMLKKKGSLS